MGYCVWGGGGRGSPTHGACGYVAEGRVHVSQVLPWLAAESSKRNTRRGRRGWKTPVLPSNLSFLISRLLFFLHQGGASEKAEPSPVV